MSVGGMGGGKGMGGMNQGYGGGYGGYGGMGGNKMGYGGMGGMGGMGRGMRGGSISPYTQSVASYGMQKGGYMPEVPPVEAPPPRKEPEFVMPEPPPPVSSVPPQYSQQEPAPVQSQAPGYQQPVMPHVASLPPKDPRSFANPSLGQDPYGLNSLFRNGQFDRGQAVNQYYGALDQLKGQRGSGQYNLFDIYNKGGEYTGPVNNAMIADLSGGFWRPDPTMGSFTGVKNGQHYWLGQPTLEHEFRERFKQGV